MPNHEMTPEEKLACLCKIVKCFCDDCPPDPPCECFDPANGEVRLTGEASPIEIHNDGTPVKLPPSGEFSTLESGLELLFDDGANTARLRYLGDKPIVAKLDATVSLERLPNSLDQHANLFLNVAQAPSALTVDLATRQRFDMLSDGQDNIEHVQGTFLLTKDDLIEVWVAKQSTDPAAELNLLVTGFVLTAIKIRDHVAGGV
jgi:hypothetical protein